MLTRLAGNIVKSSRSFRWQILKYRSKIVKMKIVDHVVRSFKVAKVFRENSDKVNSIDFSAAGDSLISCGEDDQIVIYDCEKGVQVRTINSKKYGK